MRRISTLPAALLLLAALPLAYAEDPPLPNAGANGAVQGETWQGHGFARHIKDAVELNKARAPRHAAQSAGASRKVSRRLILLEQLIRPFAWLTDHNARKWNDRGVGIVRDDFVPMEWARPVDAPVSHHGQMNDAQVQLLEARLSTFRSDLKALTEASDFAGVARRTDAELRAVEALEASWDCHLAMTKHVLEQIGFAAANAVGYVRQDAGVAGFARKFVRRLGWGLPTSPGLDRDAQAAQARGDGIILNDVPPIPFHAACARAGIALDP